MIESPYGPPLRRQSTMLRRYLFGTFRAISCDKLSYLVFPFGIDYSRFDLRSERDFAVCASELLLRVIRPKTVFGDTSLHTYDESARVCL